MGNSLISVIIPVYNVESYLASCLDSVLSQSYRNLEVIVVNDGSTDFSLKIAEKYSEADDRVKVYTQENQGLSAARNKALEMSTGEYITFVDSDDLLLPEALEVMMEIILQNNAEIVEGLIIRGEVYEKIKKKPGKIDIQSYTPIEAIAAILYQQGLSTSVCGKLFKREIFQTEIFEKGVIYEDLNLYYKLLGNTDKLIKINFPVYFYRSTEGSILNSWKPGRLDVLRVTENIEKYISEKYPEILPAAKDRRLSANFNMYALCMIHGEKEQARECWRHIKQNRRYSLFNPKVRLKNKAGILLSYLGRPAFNIIARRIYKS